jgi:HK97 family phage major capsid protein
MKRVADGDFLLTPAQQLEVFMTLQELKLEQKAALDAANVIVTAAEAANRPFTAAEDEQYKKHMDRFRAFGASAKAREEQNTILSMMGPNGIPKWVHDPDAHKATDSVPGIAGHNTGSKQSNSVLRLTADYRDAFYTYLGSNGTKMSAALYEGSNPAGGFIVPLTVEGQVVPLAPTDMGVRAIASVIPTSMDIKIPRATTISTAAGKAEGDGTGTNVFQESEPTLDQFTLSAFMAGVLHQISWELAQDVPSFTQFAMGDMLLAQQLYEENLYVNGTGTGQAQGLIGNTGVGVTGIVAGSDNYASALLAATFDVQSTLKTAYHQNAGFLMSRATATVIKKQQSQTNLFTPVWTRENGKDYLHGYPVTFSTAMPAIGAGKTPVLFGDFKQGYVVGDRGGSGINVKILDQPKAVEGILQLLAYRRTDGRVRRSEAIQAITLHS